MELLREKITSASRFFSMAGAQSPSRVQGGCRGATHAHGRLTFTERLQPNSSQAPAWYNLEAGSVTALTEAIRPRPVVWSYLENFKAGWMTNMIPFGSP